MEYGAELFFTCLSLLPISAEFSMFFVSLVLNIQLGRIKGESGDSVSMVLSLISFFLHLLISCTSLLFARVDLTLSGNPSTVEELTKAEGFI